MHRADVVTGHCGGTELWSSVLHLSLDPNRRVCICTKSQATLVLLVRDRTESPLHQDDQQWSQRVLTAVTNCL